MTEQTFVRIRTKLSWSVKGICTPEFTIESQNISDYPAGKLDADMAEALNRLSEFRVKMEAQHPVETP